MFEENILKKNDLAVHSQSVVKNFLSPLILKGIFGLILAKNLLNAPSWAVLNCLQTLLIVDGISMSILVKTVFHARSRDVTNSLKERLPFSITSEIFMERIQLHPFLTFMIGL